VEVDRIDSVVVIGVVVMVTVVVATGSVVVTTDVVSAVVVSVTKHRLFYFISFYSEQTEIEIGKKIAKNSILINSYF